MVQPGAWPKAITPLATPAQLFYQQWRPPLTQQQNVAPLPTVSIDILASLFADYYFVLHIFLWLMHFCIRCGVVDLFAPTHCICKLSVRAIYHVS